MAKSLIPQPIQSGPDSGICKGCGRSIFWIKNENGKAEPFDQSPRRVLARSADAAPQVTALQRASTWVTAPAHLPHFITCPNADNFRRRRT